MKVHMLKNLFLGKHDWIVSFDINSLYPHIIIQYNISPEKITRYKSAGAVMSMLIK